MRMPKRVLVLSRRPSLICETELSSNKCSQVFIRESVGKYRVGMMPSASDYYFDAAAQIRMDHWSQGRVVLVGDAGYCASPMSGQGTSLALIGAYVLAGELVAASGAYPAAFDHYEKEMRPFVALNQALGIKSA